jgi:hypothetical protein
MRSRDCWQKAPGVGAVLLLALLVLGAGCCVFDHDGDGIDDHGRPHDLCLMMLAGPAMALSLSGLVSLGLAVSVPGRAFIAVSLSTLDPPPRRSLLV